MWRWTFIRKTPGRRCRPLSRRRRRAARGPLVRRRLPFYRGVLHGHIASTFSLREYELFIPAWLNAAIETSTRLACGSEPNAPTPAFTISMVDRMLRTHGRKGLESVYALDGWRGINLLSLETLRQLRPAAAAAWGEDA